MRLTEAEASRTTVDALAGDWRHVVNVASDESAVSVQVGIRGMR
jgi:hypothetical protein